MMPNELDRHATELSAAWDRLLAGDPVAANAIDGDLIDTVHHISALAPEPAIPPALEQSIWTNVIAGTAELWRPEPARIPVAAHGWFGQVSAWIMRFAWMVAAGFAGGLAAGVVSRLAMRLAGFLTIERNRFMLTDNGNRVGRLTLDGTLFLGVLTGALGIVAILIYVLLRNRLPFAGWQRSLGYGVLLLAVFGYVLMDPANEDYQRFGPAWLNVLTFSSLYVFLGLFTSLLYEWGMRRNLPGKALAFRPAVRFPVLGTAALMAGIGIFVTGAAMIVGAPGLVIVGLSGVAWLVNRFALRDRLASWPAPALVQTWGLMVVPGIIGFILTARGIAEILLNQ
jgi:hypothetical protein